MSYPMGIAIISGIVSNDLDESTQTNQVLWRSPNAPLQKL
ncbi:hypothetical protein Lepto7376_1382 [[Leptolyngbya] sp. PCC 7376]|nr:hypothetical protein Lepto7376_1382 [[Leptolyngbya] sp. PCC 7376]